MNNLRKQLEAMTPGPYRAKRLQHWIGPRKPSHQALGPGHYFWVVVDREEVIIAECFGTEASAKAIAALLNAAPKLLDVVEAAEALPTLDPEVLWWR